MSNYPDDIRKYDNDPRSPFYNDSKEDLYQAEHESRCKKFRARMDNFYHTPVEGADIVTVFQETLTDIVHGNDNLPEEEHKSLMYSLGLIIGCLKDQPTLWKIIDINIDMVVSDAVTEQMDDELNDC